MLMHSDGFDHYAATTATAATITTYLQAAGYTVNNPTNTTFKVINGTDTGSLGLQMTIAASSATPPSMSYPFTSNASLVAIGFGFRGAQSRLRFCRLDGIVDLEWDTVTGKMKVGGQLGANVIIMNAWWYIEIEVDKVGQEVRIFANDVLQLTVPLPAGVTNNYTLTWGMPSVSAVAATMEIDDFYVADGSGTLNNSRLGPVAIVTRAPTSDVVKQWDIVGGAMTNHYEVAAQLDPGRANAPYLQANVEGKTDSFTSNTVMPNDNEIFAVSLVSFAKKGDLDDRQLGMKISTTSGAEEKTVPLTEGYRYRQAIFEQAPGGVAWNRNRVESSEFGIVAR